MSDHTHIEWTDATWNPVTGCSVVSAGCKHCYAMRLAGTRLRHHPSRAGLTRDTSAGPVWTGEVRLNEQWLDQPLRWRKPRRIFVCAHGDLFHESVPDAWIDRVFSVMALAARHTFQVLTKRPKRMLAWVRSERSLHTILQHWKNDGAGQNTWPLPNVWLGTSVEDQATADERIPPLLITPAAVRFISAEPLLGPINLQALRHGGAWIDSTSGIWPVWHPLDWIIAGGESGPGARPAHPDWFRSLRDQCQRADVPFFFKQWGEWSPDCLCDTAHAHPTIRRPEPGKPGVMFRCGKRRAGHLLDVDGRAWQQFPGSP